MEWELDEWEDGGDRVEDGDDDSAEDEDADLEIADIEGLEVDTDELAAWLDDLDPACLDDLDVEEIREALEGGSITPIDLEHRGIDADLLFDLGLGAFLVGGLLGGERRRARRKAKGEGEA